jgi:hypothetical protein
MEVFLALITIFCFKKIGNVRITAMEISNKTVKIKKHCSKCSVIVRPHKVPSF